MDRNTMREAELESLIREKIHSALLAEVYTTPKPGLVDLRDSGAHWDMDVHSFEKSSEAITPYLYRMFALGLKTGHQQKSSSEQKSESNSEKPLKKNEAEDRGTELSPEEELFLAIRKIGMDAERSMLSATGNVNTHKGMIFTMGILLAAAGLRLGQRAGTGLSAPSSPLFSSEEILSTAHSMTVRILQKDFEEMKNRPPKTHGERLFHYFGERGIRGQAIDGFPILRKVALPAIRCYKSLTENPALKEELISFSELLPEIPAEKLSDNAVQLNTLLSIMSELNDTNILTRSDYPTMLKLREDAEQILSLGGAFHKNGLLALSELNQDCIRKNISPGGAADILAVTILLDSLEKI